MDEAAAQVHRGESINHFFRFSARSITAAPDGVTPKSAKTRVITDSNAGADSLPYAQRASLFWTGGNPTKGRLHHEHRHHRQADAWARP
jgi:hypothetical protein